MLFSDTIFFAFFAVYLPIHILLPFRYRIYLVIVGSTVFYAWWRIDYFWLPYALTLIAWYGTKWMMVTDDERTRKWRLIVTLIVVFTPLLVVKYTYFFTVGVVGLAIDPILFFDDPQMLRWALPLGISFMTFTLTAYILDVYRGKYQPEKKLSTLLAYLLFFPHLIAGPILRPHELIPQLKKARKALDARFLLALGIFTLGLVKKLVFADQIGEWVDLVYAPGADPNGWEYLIAIYGFAIQLYADFSGYTDMAIGLALALRIRLPTNFRRPYLAVSIVDLWRRWHITLSHWLRDYLYIFALGGSRDGRGRTLFNLIVTMVLGGLWHGANWTFVIWGLVHGLGLSLTHVARRPMRALGITMPKWLAIVLTFHFWALSLVYFRAPSLADAHRVFAGPFVAEWPALMPYLSLNAFPFALIAVFFLTHQWDRHGLVRIAVRRVNKAYLFPAIAFFWILAITLSQGSSKKFVYFDF